MVLTANFSFSNEKFAPHSCRLFMDHWASGPARRDFHFHFLLVYLTFTSTFVICRGRSDCFVNFVFIIVDNSHTLSLTQNCLKAGVGKCFCRGPDNKYVHLCGQMVPTATLNSAFIAQTHL